MDYAFYRVTKEDSLGTEKTMWLPLNRLVSVEPLDSGSVIVYFDGTETTSLLIKQSAEDIFNSVVFVKSPTTYYVDSNSKDMGTI